jgi:3-phosphoinositide dependent protein kinase-1
MFPLFTVKVCEKRHILRERKGQYIRREKEVLNLLSLNHKPSVPFFVKLQCTFQDVERLCILALHVVGMFPLKS